MQHIARAAMGWLPSARQFDGGTRIVVKVKEEAECGF